MSNREPTLSHRVRHLHCLDVTTTNRRHETYVSVGGNKCQKLTNKKEFFLGGDNVYEAFPVVMILCCRTVGYRKLIVIRSDYKECHHKHMDPLKTNINMIDV